MGWLTKFFRGSTHNISEGQYHSRPAEEPVWSEPSSSPVVTDILSEFNNEDIDRAIALSLSEEEQRKARAIEKDMHLEEDEQLARAIQESLNVESPPRIDGSANGGNTYQPPRGNGTASGGNTYQPPRENGTANVGNAYQPLPYMFSSGFSLFGNCTNYGEIKAQTKSENESVKVAVDCGYGIPFFVKVEACPAQKKMKHVKS